MFNKKLILSAATSLCFITCFANLEQEFLKKTNDILSSSIKRTNVNFRVDGKEGESNVWLMTREQYAVLKELIEYAIIGYGITIDEHDENIQYIDFTHDLGLIKNEHYCFARPASFIEKVLLCIKNKNVNAFLSAPLIRIELDEDYTHVAFDCNLNINPFHVLHVQSRMYANVPVTSSIGKLPGIYLRSNGKTINSGDLIGFSYRIEKDGPVKDYFFGQIFDDELPL